jgi:hypothetical protein
MLVPDPNFFGGEPMLTERDGDWTPLDISAHPFGKPNRYTSAGAHVADYRIVGLLDMAAAVRDNRPHRASGKLGDRGKAEATRSSFRALPSFGGTAGQRGAPIPVQHLGPDLQQTVGAALAPAHLLFFHKPFADHLVDGRFCEPGRDGFSLPVPFTVIGNRRDFE